MKDIAIFGAGGFGREVACLLRIINEKDPTWNLIGFFDDNPSLKGTTVSHFGVCLGGMDDLNAYPKELSLIVPIGSPGAVQSVVGRITNPLVDFPNIYAPSVFFLDKESLQIGKGNIFCHNCLVSCNVAIGDFNLFNGYITVGHEASIGNFNVVMPSCNISGAVKMGDCNLMGVQSVILQGVKVGNNTRIGANSVIIRKTKDGNLYLGNPATIIKF